MKKLIHHLRKQPEKIRRHVLNIFILIAAAVMVILWVFSLGKNLSNPDMQTKIKQDLKPFSTLKDNIVGGYNSISDISTSPVE